MFYTTIMHIANDCRYKILHFGAKLSTEIPNISTHKNSHLRVAGKLCISLTSLINGIAPCMIRNFSATELCRLLVNEYRE